MTGSCDKCNKEDELTGGLCGQCMEEDSTEPLSQKRRATPCECGEEPVKVNSMMQCTGCSRWWHPACVGLNGLTKYATDTILQWKCPAGFKFPSKIWEKVKEESAVVCMVGERESVRETVREEIKAVMPVLVGDLVAGVKEALGESSVQKIVKDANESITKSWADIAKTEQKRVISDVVEKTSESALQKSLSRISADLSEQKTRQRNCIMSNVPEGYGGGDSSLVEVVYSFTGDDLTPDDIAHCKRLGEKQEGKRRLILVVFKREDWAAEFHNFGRGRKLDNDVWVNPDLTRTERDAKYQERKKRQEAKKKRDDEKRRTEMGNRPPVRDASDHQVSPTSQDTHEDSVHNPRRRSSVRLNLR